MGFTDIVVEESHGEKIVRATKEEVITNILVARKEQLEAQLAILDAQRADIQMLIKAIDDSPIVPTPVP